MYHKINKEMNIEMIIIGALLSAIACMPFVAVGITQRNKKKRIMRLLQSVAAENNGSISNPESVGKVAMSIDKAQRMVFYARSTDVGARTAAIRLSEVRVCKMETSTRKVASDRGTYLLVEFIALQFMPKNAQDPIQTMVLFDMEEDLQFSGELEFAERWLEMINAQLDPRFTRPSNAKGISDHGPKMAA